MLSLLYGPTLTSVHSFDCTGFPGGSVVRNLSANAGDMSLIPGLGRPPGEGNGNPLSDSRLGMEDPGRLQTMGSQRVGYSLVIKQQQ